MGPKGRGANGGAVGAPPEPRAACGFVGLENQGATCYLNSLIQALYMTPELRRGLYTLDPRLELNVQSVEEEEREKAAEKERQQQQAAALGGEDPTGGQFIDDDLLQKLTGMSLEVHGVRRALLAVKNASFEKAMEYYLTHSEDAGFLDPPPKSAAEQEREAAAAAVALAQKQAKLKQPKKTKPRLIPLELQRLFAQMQHLQQRAITTEALTTKGFQWQGYDGRIQHDAHELNRLLIEALEKSLVHTSGETLCKSLYVGELAYQTTCQGCGFVSERRDSFYDLNVQVLECPDLPRALRKYCASEILEGESAYACERCATKQTAHRSTVLKALPPLLTFSCNRFRCDKSTNWQRVKVTDKSAFPLVLGKGFAASLLIPLLLPFDYPSFISLTRLNTPYPHQTWPPSWRAARAWLTWSADRQRKMHTWRECGPRWCGSRTRRCVWCVWVGLWALCWGGLWGCVFLCGGGVFNSTSFFRPFFVLITSTPLSV